MARGIRSDVPLPEGAASRRGRYIRHVMLRDAGEYVTLRFLTDGDEAYSNRFHSVENSGKGPKWVNRVCDKAEFGTTCKPCAEDSPLTHYLFWTYELVHYYPEKPDRVETKKVKVMGKLMFAEEVNEVRLLRVTFSHRDAILTRWERKGTLLDREYDWIRGGKKGSPSYTLEALEKSKMPRELKDMLENLPDLEDVALGKVEKLGGDEEEETDDRKRYAVRRVAADDEDEDDDSETGNEFTRGAVKEDEDEEEERPKKKAQRRVEEAEDAEDDDDEDPFA